MPISSRLVADLIKASVSSPFGLDCVLAGRLFVDPTPSKSESLVSCVADGGSDALHDARSAHAAARGLHRHARGLAQGRGGGQQPSHDELITRQMTG